MEKAPLVYTNGFQIAYNQRGEAYLTFLQEAPIFDADNNVTAVEKKEVARLVLSSDLAQTLGNALIQATGEVKHE